MTVLSGASQFSGDWFKVILFDCTSLSCVVYIPFLEVSLLLFEYCQDLLLLFMQQINGDDDDITEETDKHTRNKIYHFEEEYLQLSSQHMHFLHGKPWAL